MQSGRVCAVVSAGVVLVGCSSPMERTDEAALRESLLSSHRQFLESVSAGPVVKVSRDASDVESALSEDRRRELDAMSGLDAYEGKTVETGGDLLGRKEDEVVELPLSRAIGLAVQNNLDLRVARLSPAIAEAQVVQAQAQFDAVFFTNLDYSNTDRPGIAPATFFGTGGDRQAQSAQLTTGIRQPLLATGGTLTAQTSFTRVSEDPSFDGVSPFYRADVILGLRQPLLRNFGGDIARSNIVLAKNARRSATEQLREDLITIVTNVEQAYWNLVFTRQQLLIQQQLYNRTLEERDRLRERLDFDVSPVRFTEANSLVELRRADVIRARQQWRVASDQLKRLINAPDLPLAEETLLRGVDQPVDEPVSFSLLDTVTTALRERPELRQSVLSIRDASIRQRVADNARLPQLDLTASVGLNGVAEKAIGEAYDDAREADFIDYLLGLEFEQPIGNRSADALYSQRQLERRQAVGDYQRTAQDVVLDVKNAMREIVTQYELIGAARAARRAAAENLRAIQAQEDAGVALTPEFLLDLKLQAQQRLADAESQEARARADYMTAISQLYAAMGTTLQRNRIEFDEPTDTE